MCSRTSRLNIISDVCSSGLMRSKLKHVTNIMSNRPEQLWMLMPIVTTATQDFVPSQMGMPHSLTLSQQTVCCPVFCFYTGLVWSGLKNVPSSSRKLTQFTTRSTVMQKFIFRKIADPESQAIPLAMSWLADYIQIFIITKLLDWSPVLVLSLFLQQDRTKAVRLKKSYCISLKESP